MASVRHSEDLKNTLGIFRCCQVASVVSDSVRPHRRRPTRLPRPRDSPGKNTGVGCHFLLQCVKGKSESEVAQSCQTPSDPMDCSLPGSSVHGIFQARVLAWVAIAFSGEVTYLFLIFKGHFNYHLLKEILLTMPQLKPVESNRHNDIRTQNKFLTKFPPASIPSPHSLIFLKSFFFPL